MNISDAIADRVTHRAVNLLRFEAGERRRIRAILRKLESELLGQLAYHDPTEPTRTAFQDRRLEALLAQVEKTLRAGYREADRTLASDLRDEATLESTAARRIVNDVVGVDIMTVAVPEVQLRAIASNVLIEGAPTSEWWSRQAGRTRQRFSDAIRQGMLRGETMADLIRRVRGTRGANYQDGIMQTSRNEADALVRSSVLAVSNSAVLETYRANGDVIQGVQALATLDARTTDICRARDGSSWDLETGKAFPDSPRQEPFPGPPPWHWRCRSVLTPRLRDVRAMLREAGMRKASAIRALPQTTRASMDGQVAARLTYEDWLKRKPAAFQREVLGPARYRLWKSGRYSLADMVDQTGRPLTVRELSEAA